MTHAGYHGSLRSNRIRLSRSGIREIVQAVHTSLVMTGRNER